MRNVPPLPSVGSLLVGVALVALAALSGCTGLRPARDLAPLTAAARAESQGNAPLTGEEAKAAVRRIDAARNDAQCEQALRHWQEGQTPQCRQLLEQVLKRDSSHLPARRLLADLALADGDTATAQRMLEELTHEFPDDAASLTSLAWLYESQGREADAKALFDRLETKPIGK